MDYEGKGEGRDETGQWERAEKRGFKGT